MSQDNLRMDHMVTQYVWALENDHVFMVKAQHEADRSNFNQFRRLVQDFIRPTRRMIGEDGHDGLSPQEWSYLYLEMWMRLRWKDGDRYVNYPGLNESDRKDYDFHVDRLNNAHYRVTLKGVEPFDAGRKLANPIEPIDTQENEMSQQISIANKTFINNTDVTTMSDDQLIDAIKRVEKEIEDLKAIKTKSKKITERVEQAGNTLKQLVELLDNR